MSRGWPRVATDPKDPAGVARVLELLDGAVALIEGFRPGVIERLGLGPGTVLARNPRLASGRMAGWGQTGPLAQAAGHDINYIALTGALAAIGPKQQPMPPLEPRGRLWWARALPLGRDPRGDPVGGPHGEGAGCRLRDLRRVRLAHVTLLLVH